MRFNKKNRKLRKKKKSASGGRSFWLMLLAGLILMGLFFFMMYRGQEKKLHRIHQEKIALDMDRICVAAILFFQKHGRYPSDDEGAQALPLGDGVSGSGTSRRNGTREPVPLDPWRNPYRYQAPQGETPLRLISLGSDGKPGGQGDATDVIREGCKSTALSGE
jgi:general secretion pathway protein G